MVSAVEVRNISMAFGTNQVLSGVNLTIDKGQTTALLGANGAGKSTLIKILSGVYSSFTGEIFIDGKAVTIDSPTTAKLAGIETVHQRKTVLTVLSEKNILKKQSTIIGE